MNQDVRRGPEPLLLSLPDFTKASPIVEFNAVHPLKDELVDFGLQFLCKPLAKPCVLLSEDFGFLLGTRRE